jgi:recombination protein RecR
MIPNNIDRLIGLISKLPGLGKKSASRIVLHLLSQKKGLMLDLGETLKQVNEESQFCKICGNIDLSETCQICREDTRENIICIVEQISDLWAIERANEFKGRYHILGGVLSAINGIGPEELRLEKLKNRIERDGVKEVIIANNTTIEGQITAHYIQEYLSSLPIKISKLSYGLPIGGELDYLDDSTINIALKARQKF